MRHYEIATHSADETAALAERLGLVVRPGLVVLLYGELGAGKTTFVQGLARGMGLVDYVKSPTFVLVHEYTRGPVPLFHADFYRLSGVDEALDLGLDERAAPGVFAVEWPERAEGALPEEALSVHIDQNESPDGRVFRFEALGEAAEDALAALTAAGSAAGQASSGRAQWN